jgi:glycosyltransferase involved in cell wall biosynthesis
MESKGSAKSPRVTVVMNCFNSDHYLREAIESVFQQTWTDWEIVFWDNQSTDRSAEIVRSYTDDRIRYFYAPQHTILGEARNCAIAKARGEWVALLDCDDVWHPEKLERQIELVERDPSLGLVYCDMELVDAELRPISKGSDRYSMQRGHVWEALLTTRNFIPCPSVLMKRALIESVGGFDPSLRYCEEYALFLKICRTSSADYCPEALVKYRIHGGNTTGFGSAATSREYLRVIQAEVSETNPLSARCRVRMLRRYAIVLGRLALQAFAQFWSHKRIGAVG